MGVWLPPSSASSGPSTRTVGSAAIGQPPLSPFSLQARMVAGTSPVGPSYDRLVRRAVSGGAVVVAGMFLFATQLYAVELPSARSWTPPPLDDLGTLGGGASPAYAVNDRGVVVGSSAPAGPASIFHAFTADPRTGELHDLAHPAETSEARAMTTGGVI